MEEAKKETETGYVRWEQPVYVEGNKRKPKTFEKATRT